MTQTYAARRRAETAPMQGKTPAQASAPRMVGNQSMEALMTGAQTPSAENLGHQVDLPGAIREKMESSFGADLSGVRLYESQAVADAGAQAITMGDRIGFAPGQLDFASSGGQALLGHELSHVVSQARGQVAGSGFLNDHTLEARADREGAMAAAGESVYSGPVTPLSASSVPAASGPMQAKKPWQKNKTPAAEPAPAPAEPEETFTPQQQAVAQDALQQEVISKREGRDAYEAALARYNATSETPYEFTGDQPLYYRYLNRHLRGKSEEEQDKMFKAFAEKDRKAIAPYLAADIRNFSAMDYGALDSEDDSDMANAYGQFSSAGQDMMAVSDFVKPQPGGLAPIFSAADLGLSDEELEDYKAKGADFGVALRDARISTKRMAGEYTGSGVNMAELRVKREMRKLDRSYNRGDMDEGMYRMLSAPYRRYRN